MPKNDPGPDYFTRLNPGKTKDRAIRQLESMGYTVTVQPANRAEQPQPNE
jgi:transposase